MNPALLRKRRAELAIASDDDVFEPADDADPELIDDLDDRFDELEADGLEADDDPDDDDFDHDDD